MEEIVEKDKRKGIIGYLKSGYQASRGKVEHIEDSKYELSNYDLLIVGTPVWAGKMSVPVRTYLNKNMNKIPLLACFCTCNASGIEKTIEDIGNYVNTTPLASFGVKSSDIKDGSYKNMVDKFALEVI
jgi:menaquinone-dependent protoporphyrinogen IX oxidase